MMKHTSRLALTALALLGLCLCRPAQAQRYQVQATGVVYYVSNSDNLIDSTISNGTLFTYTEVFNLAAPDVLSTDPVNGQYELSGSAYGATINIGSYTITPTGSSDASLFVEPEAQGSTDYTISQQTSNENATSVDPTALPIAHAVSSLDLFYYSPSPITSKALPPLSVYSLAPLDQSALNQSAGAGPFILSFSGPDHPNQYNDMVYGQLTALRASFLDPAPTVTTISPAAKAAGSPGFTLTVNGTGFLSNSLVEWNGVALATTYVSSTQLTASVPAALLMTASTPQVTVSIPRFATSSARTFTINGTTKWTAAAIAAGPDGKTRILWSRGDGAMTVWTLNADGSPDTYSAIYKPFLGWMAHSFSVGPDNAAHILWTNVNGTATLWTLPADGSSPTFTPAFGPITGWTATSVATDTDNTTHILWDNTDGRITLWTLPADGSISYSPIYGPFDGWTAKAIATGTGSSVDVLWDNADGHMTLWTVAADGSVAYNPSYGPIAGWTATALSLDANNSAHVLWDKTDGSMTLWTIPASGSVSYSPIFGPYSGWTALSLSIGADGDSHVLWDNEDRRMTPWTLDTNNQFVGTFPTYGPY